MHDPEPDEISNTLTLPAPSRRLQCLLETVVDDIRHGVVKQQLAIVSNQVPLALSISLIACITLVAYSYAYYPSTNVQVWGAINFAVTLLAGFRHMLAARRRERPRLDGSLQRTYRGLIKACVQVLTLGSIWGVLVYLIPSTDHLLSMAILFVLGGTAAGGAILLAAIPLLSLLWITSSLLPAVIYLATTGQEAFPGIVWIWLVYLVVIATLSVLMHSVMNSLRQTDQLNIRLEGARVNNAIAASVNQAESLDEAIQNCLQLIIDYSEWALGHMRVVDSQSAELVLKSKTIWAEREPGEYAAFTMDHQNRLQSPGDYPEELSSDLPIVVDFQEAAQDENRAPTLAWMHSCKQAGLKRCLVAPISIGSQVQAVVELFDDSSGPVSQELFEKAMLVSMQLGRAIERRNLARQTQFLSAVLKNIEDEIVACDADGYLFYNNDPDSITNPNISIRPIPVSEWTSRFELFHSDGKTRLKLDEMPLYQAWLGQEVRDFDMVNVVDGVAKRFLVSGQPIYDAHGESMGGMVSMHNVSDMRRLENQLAHARKMEMMGQLAGGVAHDFNNVLMVARGNLELLEMEANPGSESAGLIRNIAAAMDDAANLTNQLLSVSRRQKLNSQVIDIAGLVHDTAEMLARTLGTNVRIKVGMDDNLWPVKIDVEQLKMALMNILINARDAMEGVGRISISACNTIIGANLARMHELSVGDYVCLSIKDSGPGIFQEDIQRIFEPFFTTKKESKGTGLGLSIVHGFLKQSDGAIVARNNSEGGACFSLYIPRFNGLPQDIQQSNQLDNTESRHDEVEKKEEKLRILVVEDKRPLLDLIERVLSKNGFGVYKAEDEEAFRSELKTHGPFDLLLSDIMLQGSCNGFDLASEMKECYPNCQMMFMTGYVDPANLAMASEWSESQVLKKPFKLDNLLREINFLMSNRKSKFVA